MRADPAVCRLLRLRCGRISGAKSRIVGCGTPTALRRPQFDLEIIGYSATGDGASHESDNGFPVFP